MPRLRPTRIELVVDGVRLRSQLAAAALDAAGDPVRRRAAGLDLLKAALFRGRMIAKERLEAGAGGRATARLLARVTDEVVCALYDFATTWIYPPRNLTDGERLAVMAVGGYGRGTLAPFSDLDLLFLRPYKPTAHGESLVEFMLYALWDLGFKVGHSSRTVAECLKLAREDYTIRTALLEARRLAGDADLAAELIARFRDEVAAGTGPEFVAAKLRERDERHARAGASRYLVEPNVKESKGGLRDLNTLFWIAQYLHPAERPSEIVRLEAFTAGELKSVNRANDFLWAVRCHLHFAVGRAEERLSFDLQPEIARRMGYGETLGLEDGDASTAAVERFMRRYFLIAREVGVLTRTVCAKLEAEHAKAPASGLSRLLPGLLGGSRRTRSAVAPGFYAEAGRLNLDGPSVLEEDPVNLVRMFALADARNLDLHPDAFSAAARGLSLITPGLRSDPEAAALFLNLLAGGRDVLRSLTLMNEAGVLGRYIPEFGRIVGQMQFNMYHSYTVDEHSLRAVGVLANAVAGRLEETPPLATLAAPRVSDRQALFLAMLLHDTGKSDPAGQEIGGERITREVATRLGLAPARVECAAWLVRHHLAMSDFAQKRDLSDPSTVLAFADLVGDLDRLDMLLSLTVADIRAVGPGVWNGWKAQLLEELRAGAESALRIGGEDPAARLHADRRRRAERRRSGLGEGFGEKVAGGADRDHVRVWAQGMDDVYFASFSRSDHALHYALARRAVLGSGAAAHATLALGHAAAEVVIAARDRQGLFADLAGVIARAGASVAGARIYTRADGGVLDVFHVCDADGAPFGADNPQALARLAVALERAAHGGLDREGERVEPLRPRRTARASGFSVQPSVVIDNGASADWTVVEVSGADRPGLLETLAGTLAGAGLSIGSAHVQSHGARVLDAFYVVDGSGAKVAAPEARATLRSALVAALAEGPAEPRVRLARARVSAGR